MQNHKENKIYSEIESERPQPRYRNLWGCKIKSHWTSAAQTDSIPSEEVSVSRQCSKREHGVDGSSDTTDYSNISNLELQIALLARSRFDVGVSNAQTRTQGNAESMDQASRCDTRDEPPV